MVRENGKRQGIVQGENGIDRSRVTGYIIENDGEMRTGRGSVRRVRNGMSMGRTVPVEH